MKNRYEALLVLNTQGKDDAVKDIVDRRFFRIKCCYICVTKVHLFCPVPVHDW